MPTRYRRSLRLALVAGGAVVALLAIVVLGGPLLLDLPSVRAQLERQLSQAVDGKVAWESLTVRVLPSPRGVLRGVRVDAPGKATLTVQQVDVHLRLSALLRGSAEIARVSL